MSPVKNHIIILYLLLTLAIGWLPHESAAQKKRKNADSGTPPSRSRESEFYFTEGEKYFMLEDYAKALLFYQKALESSPQIATLHYKVAEVLSKSTKPEDLTRAALSIDQAIRLERNNKYFYLLAASIYTRLGRYERAEQLYDQMVRTIPGTEEYLYDLAALYQKDKKPDEAIKVYDRVEEAFGIDEVASIQRIKLYFEAQRYEEGMRIGQQLIRTFPDEERYPMALAELLSQSGQTNKAIEILKAFLDRNEEGPNARMLLAGLLRDAGNEAEARKLLLQVFDDSEVEFGSKLIVLSTYSMEINQLKRKNTPNADTEHFVSDLYSKLVAQYPENSDVYVVGGDLLMTLERNKEAVESYRKAITLGNTTYEVRQNMLYLELKEGLLDMLITDSEEALEIFPNQGMLYYFSGVARYQKHQCQESTDALDQARKRIQENNALQNEINTMLGDCYNSLREFDKSDAAYEAVLTKNPEDELVLNNYSYFLSLRGANLEKAERMSGQLIKSQPDNATYLDTHAWVLYMRGKYKDARRFIERAIATGKVNSIHYEHYGDILFKLGDINSAVVQWEKAKGLDTDNETLNWKIANRKIYE